MVFDCCLFRIRCASGGVLVSTSTPRGYEANVGVPCPVKVSNFYSQIWLKSLGFGL